MYVVGKISLAVRTPVWLTWWAASPEACWAPPHTACQTRPASEQEWTEIWKVMGGPPLSSWFLGWLLCSEPDEGSEVLGSAHAAHPQSSCDHNTKRVIMRILLTSLDTRCADLSWVGTVSAPCFWHGLASQWGSPGAGPCRASWRSSGPGRRKQEALRRSCRCRTRPIASCLIRIQKLFTPLFSVWFSSVKLAVRNIHPSNSRRATPAWQGLDATFSILSWLQCRKWRHQIHQQVMGDSNHYLFLLNTLVLLFLMWSYLYISLT